MNGKLKTATYFAAGISICLFGYLYSRQHTLVQRMGDRASTPLMVTYVSVFGVSLAVFVLLGAFDLKKFFSDRIEHWMVQGSAPTEPVPELEEAQRVRAAGDPLEAIRLLREYLQANPYNLHVMSRIAEIYRYDLGNDLAAALEYEELLKHKIPDDQWAWAALHLAKLYGRLNEFEKSVSLLERLDTKYSHTIAGRRAKKALEAMRDSNSAGLQDDSEQDDATG